MSMDELYQKLTYQNMEMVRFNKDFDLFKSNICHDLKRLGYLEFIKGHLLNKTIDKYFESKEYEKCLYLLSVVDTLCDEHNLPLIEEYSELRETRLDKVCVSESAWLSLKATAISYDKLISNSNQIFYKHNIVEGDIHDVN